MMMVGNVLNTGKEACCNSIFLVVEEDVLRKNKKLDNY